LYEITQIEIVFNGYNKTIKVLQLTFKALNQVSNKSGQNGQ